MKVKLNILILIICGKVFNSNYRSSQKAFVNLAEIR
jgi:hypothetical protein